MGNPWVVFGIIGIYCAILAYGKYVYRPRQDRLYSEMVRAFHADMDVMYREYEEQIRRTMRDAVRDAPNEDPKAVRIKALLRKAVSSTFPAEQAAFNAKAKQLAERDGYEHLLNEGTQ